MALKNKNTAFIRAGFDSMKNSGGDNNNKTINKYK